MRRLLRRDVPDYQPARSVLLLPGQEGLAVILRLTVADAAAEEWVLKIIGPWPRRIEKVVAGRDYADEIQQVKDKLAGLDQDALDYDEQHAALRAELARLRDLPEQHERVEPVDTGETRQWLQLTAQPNFLRLHATQIRHHDRVAWRLLGRHGTRSARPR